MKSLAKSAMAVTIMMLLSKILGLLREVLLANQFGTSYIVDAYTIAISLPTVLFTIFASGFSHSYLPVYSRLRDEEKKRYFFNNVLTIFTVISIFIAIVCFVGSDLLVHILAPGFDGKVAEITSVFIKIVVIYLPFYTIFNFFCTEESTKENFILSNFCNFILVNILIIVSIIVAAFTTSYVLIWGYVLSMVVATVILGMKMFIRGSIVYEPTFNMQDEYFKQMFYMAIPIGLSLFVNQLNSVVDRMFASSLGEGVTSALSYADKVQLIPYSLVVSVFITICNPRMTQKFADNNMNEGMYYTKKAVMIAIYISIPIVLILLVYSLPFVRMLFERGVFNADSSRLTAACLALYSIGIPFYAFREISTRVLTANLMQKKILKNTILVVSINCLLDMALVRFLDYKGLPIATSLAGGIACTLMYFDMKKAGLHVFDRGIIKEIIKIIILSVIDLGISYVFFIAFLRFIGESIAFLVACIIYCSIYLLFSWILRIDIFLWIWCRLPFASIAGKIKKRKKN